MIALRRWIAGWLSPELAKAEVERDWLLTDLEHNARWLGEFADTRLTLDRIKAEFEWNFRKGPGPFPSTITAFREDLRRAAKAHR